MTSTVPNLNQNPTPSPNKFSRLKIFFGVGVSIGVTIAGMYYGFNHFNPQTNSSNAIALQHTLFTRAEFERLDIQTSLAHAEAILGRGIKIRQSTTSVTYRWENPDGSKIEAEFDKQDRLISSEQDGLK